MPTKTLTVEFAVFFPDIRRQHCKDMAATEPATVLQHHIYACIHTDVTYTLKSSLFGSLVQLVAHRSYMYVYICMYACMHAYIQTSHIRSNLLFSDRLRCCSQSRSGDAVAAWKDDVRWPTFLLLCVCVCLCMYVRMHMCMCCQRVCALTRLSPVVCMRVFVCVFMYAYVHVLPERMCADPPVSCCVYACVCVVYVCMYM